MQEIDPIIIQELQKALEGKKNRKSTRPNGINTEHLKYGGNL